MTLRHARLALAWPPCGLGWHTASLLPAHSAPARPALRCCRVPHAAGDELDELQLEVTSEPPAASGTAAEAGSAAAAPAPQASEGQRQRARAAVSAMLPQLEGALQQLLERLRQK